MCDRGALRFLLIAAVLLVLPLAAAAQSDSDPEPYQPDEFPVWAQDIRRGSVIALGAVPVTVLVARMVYDIGRFTYESIDQGQPAGEYAPLFFAPADGVPLDDDDRMRILKIGVSGAAVVALADYLLGLSERAQQ